MPPLDKRSAQIKRHQLKAAGIPQRMIAEMLGVSIAAVNSTLLGNSCSAPIINEVTMALIMGKSMYAKLLEEKRK